MDTCTIFKMNNQPGPAVQHMELFSVLHGRLERRGFGGQCRCSVTESCAALCDPTGYSTPGFPVLHCPLEFAQMHVHRAHDVRMDTCICMAESLHHSHYHNMVHWLYPNTK